MSPGIIYAILTSICFGITGVVDKIGVSQVNNPLVFSLQSTSVAIIITTFIAVIFFNTSIAKELKSIKRSIWFYVILVGIFSSGIFVVFRFIGLIQTTGTFANLTQIITTSLTAIFAWIFLRERLPKKFWYLFVIILIATYFVSIGHIRLASISQGDMYIIFGTLFLASGNIFSKLAAGRVHPIILSMARFFFGGIVILVVNIFLFDQNLMTQPFVGWALISGLLWSGNVIFFHLALTQIGVTLTTSILMIGPIYTMILESVFLSQVFTPVQIVAAFIVISCGLLIIRLK